MNISNADKENLNRAPIESDTRIIRSEISSINSISCKHEYWTWDGVYAESLIFLKEDVIELSKEELIHLSSRFWKGETSEITFSEKGNYVYVNFNFETY